LLASGLCIGVFLSGSFIRLLGLLALSLGLLLEGLLLVELAFQLGSEFLLPLRLGLFWCLLL
jgi:hypothetical protein